MEYVFASLDTYFMIAASVLPAISLMKKIKHVQVRR